MHLDTVVAPSEPPVDSPNPPPAFSRPWLVAGLAVVIGLAIDTVALHQPPGFGLMVGMWIALGVASSVSRLLGEPRPTGLAPILLAGLLMASFIGIRTSPVLLSLNLGATIGVIAVLAQLHKVGGLANWTITSYWSHPFVTLDELAVGAQRFVAVDLPGSFGDDHRKGLRSVGLGVLLGTPLLLVFGGLFASADVVFSDYLRRLVEGVLFGKIFWRSLFATLVGLAIAGLWRSVRSPNPTPDGPPVRRRVDSTTGITVLGLLIALFLFFVLTQILGHSPRLERIADFSRNAREGFFQLVTVAFLVLNVLLLLDWLTLADDGRRSPAFDRLAIVLIGLTGVVMVSAMNRMKLYVTEFGYTELRFYSSVFMIWLAFVLVWFIATILRNRHARFALGLVVSGLVFIIGLNLANPDALIVNLNWDRELSGNTFPEAYTADLSVDSLPALVAIRESVPDARWCTIEQRLTRSREELDAYWNDHGILADSWAAHRARAALRDLDFWSLDGVECTKPIAATRDG
jgi:hypothetical protein